MRQVKVLMTNRRMDEYPTYAYKHGEALGVFAMPTYELIVSGEDATGRSVRKTFEVFRFGLLFKDGAAHVVGKSVLQTHVIKTWDPEYSPRSPRGSIDPRTIEDGAWQVEGNYLIHDGPDSKSQLFASIGCIELIGPKAFSRFNDLLIRLSGPSVTARRSAQLAEIGKAKSISLTYQYAPYPPLKKWS